MDLNTEMREAQLYRNTSKDLVNLINDYIDLFNSFKEQHAIIMDNLKKDYVRFFEDKGFEVSKKSKKYGDFYVDDISIKAEWADGALKFELNMYREMDRESNLKSYIKINKPDHKDLFIDIETNPSEYRIDIKSEDGLNIRYKQGLIELKNQITSSKCTIEEMECLYKVIEADKNYLKDKICLLKDYCFVGTYNENIVKFKTVSELIDKI